MRSTNLLIIMSDQHNPRVLGCAGHPQIKTPYLDRLAARGTRFASAYTNCPICVPARASFATGRHVHEIRYWDNAIAYDGRVPSWGHRLMGQGHWVTSIGKLHYKRSEPLTNGFNEEIIPLHIAEGLGDLAGLVRDEIIVRTAARRLGPSAGPGESDYNRYDRSIVAEACGWLEREAPRRRDMPWVLYVGFVAPHPPLIVPQAFFDLYGEAAIPLPKMYAESERPRHPFLDALRLGRPFDEGFKGPAMVRRAIAAYYGLVSFVDRNIGQILETLERRGLVDSTRVIYTSDHGENLGARGMWGKSTLFNESAGIPLIMAGPDIAAGRVVDTPVSLVDGFPTILECVGAPTDPADAGLPGTSLFEIASGAHPERGVLSEYHASGSITGSFMLRQGRFKYIHYVSLPPMLFDFEDDPEERHDLAADATHLTVLAECEAALRKSLDPEGVDRDARADQRALIEQMGGKEKILKRGAWTHSPPPGAKADLYEVTVKRR